MMLYYFVEFAGSFANIALLLLFIGRLFPKKEPVSRWFYAYVALLIDCWAVCFEFIPGLGDAAHDLSFSWWIFPCIAVL